LVHTKRLFYFLLLIALILNLGCSYKTIKHGTEISENQTAEIVDGKTTKQEILMKFGEPTRTMDKEKVFFYTWTRGSKGSVMGFGSGKAYSTTLAVAFDDSGVVSKHSITRGATTGGATMLD
jgi:outer membrane protein assembly factor BamE (lipoprotein component of BamABCDE complex)